MDGEVQPDITFDEADPPIGDLRTWPQIRHTSPDRPDTLKKVRNIKTGIKKQSYITPNTTKGVFGSLLKNGERHGQRLQHSSALTIPIHMPAGLV